MVKFGLKTGITIRSSAVWQGTFPTGLLAVGPCVCMYLLLFIIWAARVKYNKNKRKNASFLYQLRDTKLML